MLYVFKKRIVKIEIPNEKETPAEVLKMAESGSYPETLISDSFFVETQADGKGEILTKQKIVYDGSGIGKTFGYSSDIFFEKNAVEIIK